MSLCGAEHPEKPEVKCRVEGNTRHHFHQSPPDIFWPNDEAQQADERRQSQPNHEHEKKLREMAKAVTAANRAHARHTDPLPSHEAARRLGDLTEAQVEVYGILQRHGPDTYDGLIAAARGVGCTQTDSGIRSRCQELRDDFGLVVRAGQTRNDRGNLVYIWMVTPEIE